MDNIKKAIADLRDETPCFRVYFQTPNGSYSELVALFDNEEMYIKNLKTLESMAKERGMIVTESDCSCNDFDQIIDEVDKYRDLALTTTFVYSELEHEGSIFQMFDKCYEIAQEFCKKFSHDINWEEQELDYDEAIAEFVKEREERRLQKLLTDLYGSENTSDE
tara:strand:- start:781 stop:1272 length:492 start_codon:yes stop_codon:yes gene_type:complete